MIPHQWNKTHRRRLYFLILGCTLLLVCSLRSLIKPTESNLAPFCPIPRAEGNHDFHAQCLEDYILSIMFKHIKKGSYIDIGASDPNVDSVTQYFYLNGWRGINIEPIPQHYLELTKYRPDDINLNLGIADKAGTLPFSIIFSKHNPVIDVLSTFDKTTLENALQDGYASTSYPVQVKPLRTVLEDHPLSPIHFIKIDVEGMEDRVIQGMDLSKDRPWIFIIEAVEPRTFKRSDALWKEKLIKQGYHYAMFDGLNAYYVADEHQQALQESIREAYVCASAVNQKHHIIANAFDYGMIPATPHIPRIRKASIVSVLK